MRALNKLTITFLLSIFAFITAADSHKSQATAPNTTNVNWYTNIIDVNSVKEYAGVPRKKGVMIIDARPKNSRFDIGHIPGAYNIPFRQFDKMAHMLPADKSTLLIYYCGGAKCWLSHKSAYKAEKLGYTNIKVFADGFPDWKINGNLVAVTIPHLKKLIASGYPMMVVDSRPKKRKFAKGHIPGAINIPHRNFDKMSSLLPADKSIPLYFYCSGYKCVLSPKSAAKAMQLGYTNVHIIPEGYPGWTKTIKGTAQPKIISGKKEGTITIDSFKHMMGTAPDSIILVDVRDPDEYAGGTINGAINIPMNDFEKEMDNLPKDKNIVFLCSTGARAGEAYDIIKMLGPEVTVYFLDAEIEFKQDGSYTMKKTE